MRTLSVKKQDAKHDFSIFPNFAANGSIAGMKKLYYGKDALLIRFRGHIYKVTEEVYNFYK